jgi:hypothetical protein
MVTQHRNLRAPGEVWEPARKRAAARGTSLAAVLRSAMRAYGDGVLDDLLAPYLDSDAQALTPPPPPGDPLPLPW